MQCSFSRSGSIENHCKLNYPKKIKTNSGLIFNDLHNFFLSASNQSESDFCPELSLFKVL